MSTPAIGIDFGGTSVKIGLIEGTTIVKTAEPIPTQEFSSSEDLIEEIAKKVNAFKSDHPTLCGIGVGLPGFVDFKKGVVTNLTNVAGWKNIPLRNILSAKTGLKVVCDNDANAMAYAEYKFGAGQPYSDLIALTLGTGVGGGVILNGQLHRGANSAAGELGQMSIDYRGRIGAYGNPGALEDYIGNRELIQEAIRFYKHKGITKTAADLTPADLSELATTHDETAVEVWKWMAEKLACTLMNCCYLLNPEAFIIGGGIAKAGDLIFNPLREKLESSLGAPFVKDLKIVPAQFGNEAGMIGCAQMAREIL